MAKLKRVLEAAEFQSLSPALRELYAERGGKYLLDADDAEGLQASLDAERQRAKGLEDTLKGYGKMTPDQVRQLEESAAKATREKDFAAGNFEKILAEEREKLAKTLQVRDERDANLRKTLESALIDAEAVRAIAAQKGNAALLLPIIKARTKLQTVGDRETAVIIGDKGGPRLKTGAKSGEDFMDIAEYVAELKGDKTYAGAFEAGVGSGSGGQPRTAPAGSQPAPRFTGKIAEAIKSGATILTKDM